ncbi:MAG TPA: (Fe-S)-binding protein, partial [Thermoanaerobaculia bacterium]|nr:(Fe-S)-binding protein [Thermoanaerobaculia bacterium]
GIADSIFRGLVFAVFPFPARLRAAGLLLWLLRVLGLRALLRKSRWLERLSPRLAQLDALAPDRAPADLLRALPALTPADGEPRLRVGLVAGCVQRVFFPAVHGATLRVLAAEGCEAVVPEGQGCCGALSLHSGRRDEARTFARALVRSFDDAAVDVVLTNAAGCGSALKEYGRLFDDDPEWRERARLFAAKVRDVTELLSELAPRAPRHRIEARVAYHDACHLAHAQGIRRPPRLLLEAIPGLSIREIPQGEQCCGSAGTYNLFEPESANEIGLRKVESVLRTGADLLVSANPGCTLHLQRLMRARDIHLRAMHPVELLDKSLRGETIR